MQQGGDGLEPLARQWLQDQLDRRQGQTWYVHLETTMGAYTKGSYGLFARNARWTLNRGHVAGGEGGKPFRVALSGPEGWIWVEGLTHGQVDEEGRLLLMGQDDKGRLTVALELSPVPFPVVKEEDFHE